jgi:uncharacterized protein YciW
MSDVVDRVAGIAADSPLGLLRRQRADIFRHTQGSHDVLVTPADPGGVSLQERAAIALLLAEHDADLELAAHYYALLEPLGGMPAGARWEVLQRHTKLLAAAPDDATAADLRRLEAAGLSSRDIVAVSQLIAFVSYQVRLLAGLRLLKAGGAA